MSFQTENIPFYYSYFKNISNNKTEIFYLSHLAVSTPGSVELHQDILVAVDGFLEIILSQYQHPLICGNFSQCHSTGEKKVEIFHFCL